MNKEIEFDFPEVGIKFSATLWEENEPELCTTLWKKLESPIKLFCRHTLSTGCEFGCASRPPKHPVKSGTQAQPLATRKTLLSRLEPGNVVYSIAGGMGEIVFCYGPCTEPLPARGGVVARAIGKDLNELVKVGKAVWNAQYITHSLITVIARRKV
jgi:hypothetical protein